jgi:hypothetical protein
MPDRWASRDLPFLVEAARQLDAGLPSVQASQISDQLGWSIQDALAAASALVPTYLTGEPEARNIGRTDFFLDGLTEGGRRTVGLWPDDDTADALVEALERAAEATDDPEEKSRIRKAARALGKVGTGILTEVTAAVISRQIAGG